LALAEQAGDRASTVTILTDLGNTHILLSDYPQARAAYERGLQIARQLGDRRGTGGALVSLGILAKTLGDYDQALDYFQQGLQLAEETGDKSLIATALGNLGSLYHVRGDFARALAAYQRSLRLREESKHAPGIAVMLTNIGLIYKAQGNYALALDYLQRGLTVKREINDRPSISSSLSHLGSLYADQRDYARALDYLRQSLALSEGLGDRSGIAHTLSHIGLTYYEQGDYKTALDHWQRSLAIRETIGERAGVANAWAKIADAYLKLGQPAEAADYAGRAAAVARQIGQPELLMNARTSAGLAQEALGQPAAARESLLGAVAAAESLRLLAAGDEQEQGRSFESLVAPYNALIGLSVRQRDPVQALLYADRAKGRVLLDVLRDGRVNITKAMTPDEVRQERALAAAMAAPNAQLARLRQQPDPDAAQVSALSARLDQARLAYQAFQTGLYAEHPQLQTQRGHASPLTSADAAALLPDAASALLEYAVTEDETYLFVVTRGGDGASPDVRAYPLGVKGAELSQLQGVTRLRIVPDGPLWELPFQALHAGPRGYLIEQYAVSYAPSLAVLREMRRRRDGRATPPHAPPTVRRGAGLLALGNPSLGGTAAAGVEGARDEPLSPLPSAEREVNVLGQLYGRGQSRVLVGPEARESAVKREAGNYRVLHFATHALLDDHNPMYSRIMLASEAESSSEDGLLEAWEVMRLDLSAELVVLSSCQTARGRVAAGEGTIGISWALFVAGCPAEVVSQWQVDSARTTELMIEFHRNLVGAPSAGRRSPTKAEALQRAALKMLRGPYSHPAYWAAFVLIGDER
jgi:tetratricopeptide (TPR) repeat protein